MKKILMLLFLMVSSLVLVACDGDKVTLEWETMPKSVYTKSNTDAEAKKAEADFLNEVKVRINEKVYSLGDAVGLGATVTGFDTTTSGLKTVTVKYESLTITWSFVVEPKEDEFKPSTDWYNESATTFTLMTEEELFGLAILVNAGTADFAGKTVKLGKDMDLSDKVWTPIGQGTRKEEPVQLTGDAVTSTMMTEAAREFDPSKDYREDGKEYIYLSSYKFAVRTNASDVDIKYYDNSSDLVQGGSFFKGTFDGQNHKIKGLSDVGYTPTVTRIYANSVMVLKGYVFGLFGIVEGNVTIKDVVFENVAIIGAYYDSANGGSIVKAEIDSVGAAIGYVNKIAGNLVVENVKVLSGSITASNAAAGIVGRFYNIGTSLFKDVENHANMSVLAGGNHAGGIAGFGGTGKIEFINAKNYGNITVATKETGGGIVNGAGSTVFIIDSSNFGTISGTSIKDSSNPRYGLVGYNGNNANVTNSLNFGTVK